MKILITTETYYPMVNGVVRSLSNLKNSLEDRGHEVKILTLSHSVRSYKTDDAYYVGSLSAEKIYPDARIFHILAKTYLRELAKWEPDIIHTQSEFSTFVMAILISMQVKCPIIHTYHTVYEDYTHYITRHKKAGVKLVAVASKTWADRVDYMIAPTEKTAEILESYKIPRDKLAIIPTGIKIPEIYDRDLRAELGIGKDEKVMLYLGRLAEEKNVEEIIDYFGEIEDERVKLYIVGGGPHLEKLKAYSQNAVKKVNFVGMVDPSEVNKYYQAADVFVTASTSETQGLTYYEALSNGTPVVAREDRSLNGVVKDGFNGYSYRTYEEFEKYVTNILNDDDLKNELSKNARAYAVDNFSVESFGEKCEALYEKAKNEYKYESSFIFKGL